MDPRRIEELKERLGERPIEELVDACAAHDENVWTPEALEAMRRILHERGVPVPAVKPAEERRRADELGFLRRLAGRLSARAEPEGDWRVALPAEDAENAARGLRLVRASAPLANLAWWAGIAASSGATRSVTALAVLLYGLPYLVVALSVGRPTRLGVVLAAGLGVGALVFVPLLLAGSGLALWFAEGLPRSQWIVWGLTALLLPCHMALLVGAALASKAVRPAVRWWWWGAAALGSTAYLALVLVVLALLPYTAAVQ